MLRQSFLPALLLLLSHSVAGCGARSPLHELAADEALDASVDAAVPKPDAAADAPGDQATLDVAPPPICSLAAAGEPLNLAPSPSVQSYTPSIVALSPGNAATSEPAHVVASWLRSDADSHPTTVAQDFQVGPVWPDGVVASHKPIAVGPDSHTWNELSVAPGGGQSVSLVWWDDPGMVGRLRFRTLDVGHWTMSEFVDLTSQSSEALGLAAGAGLGHPSGYGGEGYGLLWRVEDYDTDTSMPAVVVLDAAGQIVMGPHQVAAISSTKRTPAITWTGTTYLIATAFGACESGDLLCKEDSLVISRVRPPSGDAVDDSGVEVVHAFPAFMTDGAPRRPTMISQGGKTYVAWFEGVSGDAGTVPMAIRIAELGQDGTPVLEKVVVPASVFPLYSLSLSVLSPGVTIAWAEAGDPVVPSNQPGASRLRVLWLDAAFEAVTPEVAVDITEFQSWGSRAMVSLDWPRGAMLVWTGMAKDGGSSQVHGLRLDCR